MSGTLSVSQGGRGTRHTNSLGTLTTCGKSNVPISYFIVLDSTADRQEQRQGQDTTFVRPDLNQQLLLSLHSFTPSCGLPF